MPQKPSYDELWDAYLAVFETLPPEVRSEHLRSIAELAHSLPLPRSPEDKRIDDIASDLLSDVDI